MINLVKADIYKETSRKTFKLSLILTVLFTFVFILIINNKVSLKKDINLMPIMMEEEYLSVNKYGSYEQYKIDYDLYLNETNKEIEIGKYETITKSMVILESSTKLMYILGLFIIFKVYQNISYDYQKKTIRYVYQSSYSRFKIILSKLISLMFLTFIYTLLIIITSLILSFILTNENIFNIHKIVYYKDKLFEINYIFYYLKNVFVYYLPISFMIILTTFLSILFEGNSFSLIISTSLYLISLTISNLSLTNNINIVKYTFLPYLDFSYYENNIEVLFNNAIYNTNFSYINASIIFIIYNLLIILLIKILVKKDV